MTKIKLGYIHEKAQKFLRFELHWFWQIIILDVAKFLIAIAAFFAIYILYIIKFYCSKCINLSEKIVKILARNKQIIFATIK